MHLAAYIYLLDHRVGQADDESRSWANKIVAISGSAFHHAFLLSHTAYYRYLTLMGVDIQCSMKLIKLNQM